MIATVRALKPKLSPVREPAEEHVDVNLSTIRQLQAELRRLARQEMPTEVLVSEGMSAAERFRAEVAALDTVKINIATLKESCAKLGELMESIGLLKLKDSLDHAIKNSSDTTGDLTALNQNQRLLADSYKKYLDDFIKDIGDLESRKLQGAKAVSSQANNGTSAILSAIQGINDITDINHAFIPQPSVKEQQEKTVEWSNLFAQGNENGLSSSPHDARKILSIFKTGAMSRLTQVGGHLETLSRALQPPLYAVRVMPKFEQENTLFMLIDKKENYNNLSEKEDLKLRELLMKACDKCASYLPEPLLVKDTMKTYELMGIFERMYNTLEAYIDVQVAIQDTNEKMGYLYSSPLHTYARRKYKEESYFNNEPSYWDRLQETFIITNLAGALAECHKLTLKSEANPSDKDFHERSVKAA